MCTGNGYDDKLIGKKAIFNTGTDGKITIR
jgi:hypothetical protein